MQRVLFSVRHLLVWGSLAILIVGCSSSASTIDNTSGEHRDVVDRWEQAADAWDGVPHQWGGTTRRGIDCSGLVQVLYRDVANVDMPRTTSEQVQIGDRVRQRDLAPGDLVFFHYDKGQHVGVYIESGRFVHASSSRGVMVSNLNESYWQDHYWTARRVDNSIATASSEGEPPSSSQNHGGW